MSALCSTACVMVKRLRDGVAVRIVAGSMTFSSISADARSVAWPYVIEGIWVIGIFSAKMATRRAAFRNKPGGADGVATFPPGEGNELLFSICW